MPLVTWKDLCVDVNDPATAGPFWAEALGLRLVPDGDGTDHVHLEGPTPGHTVWLCRVPEPKTVKDRVHLDVHSSEPLLPGATRLSAPGEFPWTVQAGPEGDELCTFVRDEVPGYRLYEVCADVGPDHRGAAAWWQALWGGTVGTDDEGAFSWVEGVPGMPFESLVFCAVPEPKTVKNRIHWDVTLGAGASVEQLVERGATVLRHPDDEVRWTVMADPEGHEFCVFETAGS
jgi:catechol 2,3-dioxygenase-like lactoylglutathione lyase family enzyme